MINIKKAQKYCKEDLSKIENYEQAVNDTTQVWDLHHRTEIWWNCTKKDLIENECYYNRKACELIFLTHAEHTRIHNSGELNSMYGKTHTQEARKKISESKKGRPSWNKGKHNIYSADTLKKMSKSLKGKVPWNKGKTMTQEARKKMSEVQKGRIPWNKGKKGLTYKKYRKRTDINNNVMVTSTTSLN